MLNLKKALTKLAEKLYDVTAVKTGTLTAKNGFTLSEVSVRQVGHVVHIKGYATKSGGVGTNQIEMAQISGVSTPLSTIRTLVGVGAQPYNAEATGYALIESTGRIAVRPLTHGTSPVITFSFIYVV